MMFKIYCPIVCEVIIRATCMYRYISYEYMHWKGMVGYDIYLYSVQISDKKFELFRRR